jgi:hypothetical protein
MFLLFDVNLPWQSVNFAEKMKKRCYMSAGSVVSDCVQNTSHLNTTNVNTCVV